MSTTHWVKGEVYSFKGTNGVTALVLRVTITSPKTNSWGGGWRGEVLFDTINCRPVGHNTASYNGNAIMWEQLEVNENGEIIIESPVEGGI